MADKPGPAGGPEPAQIDEQLVRTAEDLRALAEAIGAVPPGEPKMMSLRTARITVLAVVVGAGLASYWLWSQWHSVLFALAPLIWIFESGRRWRKRTRGPGADTEHIAEAAQPEASDER
jgi:hypothetical protein